MNILDDNIYRPVNRWALYGRAVKSNEHPTYSFGQTEPAKRNDYSHLTTLQLIEAKNTNERICSLLDTQRSCSINPLLDDQYRVYRMFLLAIESELDARMVDVLVEHTPETAINVPVSEMEMVQA